MHLKLHAHNFFESIDLSEEWEGLIIIHPFHFHNMIGTIVADLQLCLIVYGSCPVVI